MEVNLHSIHIFHQILTNISNLILQLHISSTETNYFSATTSSTYNISTEEVIPLKNTYLTSIYIF